MSESIRYVVWLDKADKLFSDIGLDDLAPGKFTPSHHNNLGMVKHLLAMDAVSLVSLNETTQKETLANFPLNMSSYADLFKGDNIQEQLTKVRSLITYMVICIHDTLTKEPTITDKHILTLGSMQGLTILAIDAELYTPIELGNSFIDFKVF